VLSRIHDLVLDDSQFVIATHSPILMAYPDAWIYHCSNEGMLRIAYEDTDHDKVTRDFLSSPARMLKVLLER
jgi:predicted ATPase